MVYSLIEWHTGVRGSIPGAREGMNWSGAREGMNESPISEQRGCRASKLRKIRMNGSRDPRSYLKITSTVSDLEGVRLPAYPRKVLPGSGPPRGTIAHE